MRKGLTTKKKKTIKTPTKTRQAIVKKKAKKQHCPITNKPLHGVPHGKKRGKLNTPKTKKRPTTLFGGTLSAPARRKIIEEAIKIKHKIKKIEDTNPNEKKYVKQALKKIEE
jgi:ribosomal protein L34E